MSLIKEVKKLKQSKVKFIVNKRLKEFESVHKKQSKEWFSELCYCILTANSKAVTALNIQKELGAKGFCNYNQTKLSSAIKRNKHRFHNNKAKYIKEARSHIDIKTKIKNLSEPGARTWIVKNIKGLGFKESSHFLRNVGYKNLAILDRHILTVMHNHKLLKQKPKTLNKKNYLEIENQFLNLAKKLSMSAAELDLYMWYLKTGKVLK